MTNASTRRNFLKAGAIVSAPLAMPVAALASDSSKTRLVHLEDERALRDLHQTWLRSVNTGAVNPKDLALGVPATDGPIRRIAPSLDGPPDDITIAANGAVATGRFSCTVGFEKPLARNCTAAQMAYLQGGGVVRRTENRVVVADYAKADGIWSIARVRFAEV